MSKDMLSISDLARQLGITYQGAIKKVKSNLDSLEPYIIYGAKGNIKGIKPDALQVIYNLPYRQVNRPDQEQKQTISNELMLKDEIIKTKQEFIDELIKDKEEMKAKITALETELETYRQGNIFTRLLGYKKR